MKIEAEVDGKVLVYSSSLTMNLMENWFLILIMKQELQLFLFLKIQVIMAIGLLNLQSMMMDWG